MRTVKFSMLFPTGDSSDADEQDSQPFGVDERGVPTEGVATFTGKISVLSSLFFFGFGSGAVSFTVSGFSTKGT